MSGVCLNKQEEKKLERPSLQNLRKKGISLSGVKNRTECPWLLFLLNMIISLKEIILNGLKHRTFPPTLVWFGPCISVAIHTN